MKLFFKRVINLTCIIIIIFFACTSQKCKAWGPEGHAIVGNLAMQFVKDDVRRNVLDVLGSMSVDTAANWMDIMKSNQDYDFMRPWHYIDFPKKNAYQPDNKENIINRLIITFNELKHRQTLCSDQVKTDLLVLMHLIGDLHMPLHTAYDDDLGGNQRIVQYDTIKTHNLHRFWDEDIISLSKITIEDCIKLYNSNKAIDTIKGIDFVRWMNENRSLLGGVYDFPGFTISEQYLSKNKLVVEARLLLAGLRLAAVLDKLFFTPALQINFQEVTSKYKNGIDIKDAVKNISKKVTVCSRVYGIRSTEKITQINLGEKYPASPLTVVIFSSSYSTLLLHPMRCTWIKIFA